MAREVTIKCDVYGDAPAEPHRLQLDGRSVTLDLGKKALDELTKALDKFFKAGTVKEAAANGNGEAEQIRAWARQHGHNVADKGKLPANIIEAFHNAKK